LTQQDLLLVVGLAGSALGITLVDLLWSGWRHRRRSGRPPAPILPLD